MVPIHYFGWVIIALAVLRLKNKACISLKWRLAFASFTGLYSLGELTSVYGPTELTNIFYMLSAASFLIPFLKYDLGNKRIVEKVSDTSLLLGIGIIVLLSGIS
ncbi:hypothetical protein [Natranaerobius trueperi]|uniref:Uncharacterized protein n=1 Tax=Natranaerobius trueperi TaxID=759412 RepID=A0A226BW64_9FIRM|nr:hypothetical protein [Natranaerobius trueperi]OWZ83022.1 hypothetical protein CDO51_10685 [Natranaerobius trueperi]